LYGISYIGYPEKNRNQESEFSRQKKEKEEYEKSFEFWTIGFDFAL